MTTLVLQAANTAIGGLASAATSYLTSALVGAITGSGGKSTVRTVEGPRLTEMSGLASTEGAPIPRLYGRARLGGQLIWGTRFEEVANTAVERQTSRGGKGLGGSRKTTATTVTTSYSYHANLAIGLCEAPIAFVRRVWADGREVDLTQVGMRVHRGLEDQEPDPLIVAKEGAENAPAYRGLAYVVFERLPLDTYGNRVPQFSFEVVRPVGGLPEAVRSVCLIPGASEFGLDPVPVRRTLGLGASAPENTHQLQRATGVEASLDWLQALCPNLRHVSLVVSWFADDLRAGACTVAPRIEHVVKDTEGGAWAVAGLDRASAREVSRSGGAPAYGGTPSDESVKRLIGLLKARGLSVTLYPFVMMDVPAGNDLPDPRSGTPGQPPYPWRGRITCDPAPGVSGSPDGTAPAGAQVAGFFAGPGDWGFRRLVRHYAELAVEAGGVNAFVIGSELVGLTRVRAGPGAYPAVDELRALAGQARAILGPGTKLTYAADWTEYGPHVLGGGAELRFPLDPLWADPNIDAVGIDYYPPISDWRDGPVNADAALAGSPYEVGYLRERLGSGEAFDWYYPDDGSRAAQSRMPISDGAYDRPWVFRAKDLVGWWSNPHVERVGGVETEPTPWVPAGKPIWLTEIGVPAVDKGPNGPNVFPDPKSSESAAPPFSNGARDDLVQARALEAILSRFDPALAGHRPEFNPWAGSYGGRMVDPARVSVWAWDARPFPAFPDFDTVWADGANWRAGHWITGRLEGVPLDRLVRAIMSDFGLDAGQDIRLDGILDGYVIDRPMSARAALEPLQALFGFDAVASAGSFSWRGRGGAVDLAVPTDDVVERPDEPLVEWRRAQETDLPVALELGFTDAEGEYGRAAVGSRRLAGSSRREASLDVAVATWRGEAQRLADIWLQDAWAGRDTVEFAVSPRARALEPGDVLSLPREGGAALYRVRRIADGPTRLVTAEAVEPAIFHAAAPDLRPARPRPPPQLPGRPLAVILDLPASGDEPVPLQYLAVAADPWPGAVAVWRSGDGASFSLHRLVEIPALIGRTREPFASGPVWRFDRGTSVEVEMSAPALSSIDDISVLAGGNLFAIRGADESWEVFSAASAEMTGPGRYRLSRLLRGLGGTEHLSGRAVAAGATIVRLDAALLPLATAQAELGATYDYRIGPAERPHTDPSYVSLSATMGSGALRPLGPVHARARRGADGIEIGWVRRTRIDGDAWDVVEVPLGEETERYELDVLSGSDVVRTLAAGASKVLYPAAAETADFGWARSDLTIRIVQLSAAVGRGQPLEITVPVE